MTTQKKSEVLITPPPGTDPSQTKEVANGINNHFVSIGKDIKPLDTCNLPAYQPIPQKLPEIHPWQVSDKLSKIGRKKAGGPDGIPAKLIREFPVELSIPLTHILNQSFAEGSVPPQWKRAIVVPYYRVTLLFGINLDQCH